MAQVSRQPQPQVNLPPVASNLVQSGQAFQTPFQPIASTNNVNKQNLNQPSLVQPQFVQSLPLPPAEDQHRQMKKMRFPEQHQQANQIVTAAPVTEPPNTPPLTTPPVRGWH